jgi:hypothetical protein
MRRLVMLIFIAFPVYAPAQDEGRPPNLEALPEAPTPPPPVQNGEAMEPEITIVRSGKKIIQEFRQGGRLYKVKVVPDVGPPYYFFDTNNDGTLDIRSSDPDKGSYVNVWKLFEWDW